MHHFISKKLLILAASTLVVPIIPSQPAFSRTVNLGNITSSKISALSKPSSTKILAQAQNCLNAEEQLPWTGFKYLVLVRKTDGTTVYLQRNVLNGVPSALVYINKAYQGQYPLPLDLIQGQLLLRLKQMLVLETWNGQVRQVYKSIPFVVFCSNTWSSSFVDQ